MESTLAARACRGASLGATAVFIGSSGVAAAPIESPVRPTVAIIIAMTIATALALLPELLARIASRLTQRPRGPSIARSIPTSLLGFVGLAAFLRLPLATGLTIGLLLVPIGAVLGAAIGGLSLLRTRERPGRDHLIVLVLLAVGTSWAVGVLRWMTGPGIPSPHFDAREEGHVDGIPAPNPGDHGARGVHVLLYGSARPGPRPEYGPEVELKTTPIDASAFFTSFEGSAGAMRRRFWGFDATSVPRNGRVWMPDGDGAFPVVLIAHGNHDMGVPSENGYGYLAGLLASRGFIVASIDETFLNESIDDVHEENDARAWLLLEHLSLFREWSRSPGSPFHRKVDLERIALIGHSRGGEAVVHAALFNRLEAYPDDATIRFDFHFAIKALVAIAPSEGQYEPGGHLAEVENVNYLVMQGGHDADQTTFEGEQQFTRVHFTDGGDWLKASVYAYRANHNQFNTEWGTSDYDPPAGSWLLNRASLLSADAQRTFACVYVSAFLEATLRGSGAYRAAIRDPRTMRAWLPSDVRVTRFEDATFRKLAGYEEDADVTTGTWPGVKLRGEGLSAWKEAELPLRSDESRRHDSSVQLGWTSDDASRARAPLYAVRLPADGRAPKLGPDDAIVFQLALSDDAGPIAIDFTIRLLARNGATAALPLSHFRSVPPPLRPRLTKLDQLEATFGEAFEPHLQTVQLPLADFMRESPLFELESLEEIQFVFDRGGPAVVVMDDLGFARR